MFEVVNVPPLPSFPPILIVLSPVDIRRACAAVPEKVISPLTSIVPVLTLTVQNLLAVALPGIEILEAFNIPAPTAIVEVITPADGAFIVIAPPTFNVIPELIFTALFAAGAFNVRLEQAASTVTVIVCPVSITAVAPAVGTMPPVQVAGVFQFPEAAEFIARA